MNTPDTREWLATNGLGGYASGTVCGANTRRYHGLLVAALEPPGRRTVLLQRIDEVVHLDDRAHELSTSFWQSGAVGPEGFRSIDRFSAEPIPTWELSIGPVRLRKQLAPLPSRNAVVVGYSQLAGPPIRLELKLLANCRDFHGDTHGHPDWHFRQTPVDGGIEVAAWDGAPTWRLAWGPGGAYRWIGEWYWGYGYPEEAARGLQPSEDAYCLGALEVELNEGGRFDLLASVDPLMVWPTAAELTEEHAERRRTLVEVSGLLAKPEAEALVAAADQFLVRRESTGGSTVIAGYHWFGDWGRDTMIALPGLTLTTGRPDQAAQILRTFGRYVDRGMLPNRFPEAGEAPEYNTVDATLWWFHALDAYVRASGDLDLAREQFPLLTEVVDWHVRGTRHGIRLDPDDGLLLAGEPGLQLTWMDAKIGDWVVTPRTGKPVEVNALWFNGLVVMAEQAERLGQPDPRYRELAEQARAGMQKFWSQQHGYLYDVLDAEGNGDASLRPNQLFALSLPNRAFSPRQEASALEAVRRSLLTPYGLRTLAPDHPAYAGHYGGDSFHRDSVYHQGTVWPWLIGAYADAVLNVRGRTPGVLAELRDLIAPLLDHLRNDACLGSVSEIFDGDSPHAPRGCVAQAWSVAELLRVYAAVAAEDGHRSGRALAAAEGAR